jgi:hypothetical protein
MKARIILFAVLVMMVSACGDKGSDSKKGLDITGQWELIDIETKAAQIGGAEIEVYIEFNKDNTFNLWQMIGAGRFEKMTGTWTLNQNVLSGKYSDKKDWGTTYDVAVESGNLVMTEMKTGKETCIYRKCTIPSDIQ